ncbi:A24 family peptidase [uncultured Bifidobacterium sp.]|uniref:prepilin peptidase n=1 Tax=uncultured Bifidobacterium sp. TaxID=165187 RepID=UPI0026264C76|nr:A24 family peptidase [uncultured Bifidobacterium sp.]
MAWTSTAAVTLAASLIIGLVFGSFLNVVIWRVPNAMSLVEPRRSICPRCRCQIAWYDNIPLISFMVLNGRCRNCHEPISARYPLVEALGGLACVAVTGGWLAGLYTAWILPELYVLALASIAIAAIDLDHQLILNVIVYPLAIVTLALLTIASAGTGEWHRLVRALISAVVLAAFYLLLGIIWKGGMGMGDVKLSALLGLVLGWLGIAQLITGAFAAFLIGGVIAVVELAKGRVKLKGGIPFGPSMVAGAWLGIFAGAAIAEWYLNLAGLA